VTLSRSRPRSGPDGFLAVAAVAIVGLLLAVPIAEVVTTDLFIVPVDEPVTEDVYVVATSGIVEGVIDGDLVMLTGDLVIEGSVTGDVLVLGGGRVEIASGGRVGGSLRAVAREVVVSGAVSHDVLATAAVIGVDGNVGRDMIGFGATVDVDGDVGRDVRGRALFVTVAGTVGGDLDVAVERLRVAPTAEIARNVLYRSTREASIDPAARIGGQVVALPAQSNFIFGVFLVLANVVGFLGFVVAGIVSFWAFRRTAPHAVAASFARPGRTLIAGLVVFLAVPATIALVGLTLVGVPLALVLMLAMAAGAFIGPVPAVTAAGIRLLRGRGGLFGGFLVGAIVWTFAIWFVPRIGGLVYLVGLIWGLGSWAAAVIEIRRGAPLPLAVLPPRLVASGTSHGEGWEPPRVPGPAGDGGSAPVAGPSPDRSDGDGDDRTDQGDR